MSKVKGLYWERRNIEVTDVDEIKTYTHKNFYWLTSFDILNSFESVVDLDQKVREEYYHYYSSITTLLPNKINMQNCTITTITLNNKINNNICSNDNDESTKIPISICKNENMCNNGNSVAMHSENAGNSASNIDGNKAEVLNNDLTHSENIGNSAKALVSCVESPINTKIIPVLDAAKQEKELNRLFSKYKNKSINVITNKFAKKCNLSVVDARNEVDVYVKRHGGEFIEKNLKQLNAFGIVS